MRRKNKDKEEVVADICLVRIRNGRGKDSKANHLKTARDKKIQK
jgi:hypothetical protein